MLFDQQFVEDRCATAAATYRLLGGQASEFHNLVASTESRLQRVESRLQATLPPTLRAAFLRAEAVQFEWSIPREVTADSVELAAVTCGKLHWDLADLWRCEQLRRAWVKSDFRDRSLRRNHLWQDALPVISLGNGEFIALDLRSTTGETVVYLDPKLAGLHGVELAPTFDDFIGRVTRLGCPGPDQAQLAPFVSRSEGIDVSGTAAEQWLSLLEHRLIRQSSTARDG